MAAFAEELVIDPVSGEQITPKHAILVPMTRDSCDIVQYVKSVGSIIGVKNIRSVYRVGEYAKMYLRFLKHVDIVASSGVDFEGRHVKVKYQVPPATEVVLENVDTDLPNVALRNSLEKFGTLAGKITTDKLDFDDPELSHIETNIRRAYLNIKTGVVLPPTLTIKYSSNKYCINVTSEKNVSSEQLQYSALDSSSIVEDTPGLKRRRVSENTSPTKSSQITDISARRRGRPRKTLNGPSSMVNGGETSRRSSHSPLDATQADNLALVVKVDRPARVSRPNASSRYSTDSSGTEADGVQTNAVGLSSTSNMENDTKKPPDDALNDSGSEMHFNLDPEETRNCRTYPFSFATLQKFLKAVKNHRNPLEVALDMLKESNAPDAVEALCAQLIEYQSCCSEHSLKHRIDRLVQIFSTDNV